MQTHVNVQSVAAAVTITIGGVCLSTTTPGVPPTASPSAAEWSHSLPGQEASVEQVLIAGAYLSVGGALVAGLVRARGLRESQTPSFQSKGQVTELCTPPPADTGLRVRVLDLDGIVLGGITADLPTYTRFHDGVAENCWISANRGTFEGRLRHQTASDDSDGYLETPIHFRGRVVNVDKPAHGTHPGVVARIGRRDEADGHAA